MTGLGESYATWHHTSQEAAGSVFKCRTIFHISQFPASSWWHQGLATENWLWEESAGLQGLVSILAMLQKKTHPHLTIIK